MIPTSTDFFTNVLALATVISPNDMQEIRNDVDVSGKILYIGRSMVPNANPDDNVWYIVKFYFDVNGFWIRQQIPDDGPGYKYSYTDRATYFS